MSSPPGRANLRLEPTSRLNMAPRSVCCGVSLVRTPIFAPCRPVPPNPTSLKSLPTPWTACPFPQGVLRASDFGPALKRPVTERRSWLPVFNQSSSIGVVGLFTVQSQLRVSPILLRMRCSHARRPAFSFFPSGGRPRLNIPNLPLSSFDCPFPLDIGGLFKDGAPTRIRCCDRGCYPFFTSPGH